MKTRILGIAGGSIQRSRKKIGIMKKDIEYNLGTQPFAKIMVDHGLKSQDLDMLGVSPSAVHGAVLDGFPSAWK